MVEKYAKKIAADVNDEGVVSAYMETYFDKDGTMNEHIYHDIAYAAEKYGTKEINERKLSDVLNDKIKDTEYDAFIERQLDKLYRNPKIQSGRKKLPVTLENVVRAMVKSRGAARQETMTFGDGKILASLADRFGSLEEIRANKDKLTDREKAEVSINAFSQKADHYRNIVASHYDGSTWAALDDAQLPDRKSVV